MSLYSDSNNIAHIIQLAVAPVFLLAGIAGFLGVMSGRLGRIIDRERVISRRINRHIDSDRHAEPDRDAVSGIATQTNDERLLSSQREHKILMRRAHITNRAIGLCTGSALVVCTLIASLFIDEFFKLGFSHFVVTLFILALGLLIIALLMFLREIQLATRTLGIAKETGLE